MATKVENRTKVEGDEVLLSKGYGYADLEKEIPCLVLVRQLLEFDAVTRC